MTSTPPPLHLTMKPEQIRIAIAEAVGFSKIMTSPDHEGMLGEKFPMRGWLQVPNYLTDLNAIVPVIESLPYGKQAYYMDHLTRFVMMKDEGVSDFERHNATAAQRCEAFLRCLGLWIEGGEA